MQRKFLFIFCQPPYRSTRWRDGLDALLAAAAFGQRVSVVLMGEAVLQLLPNQDPRLLPAKSPMPLYDSLALYEIERIYIARDALEALDLPVNLLPDNAALLNQTEIQQLIFENETCLTF
jgi:tRNA 2-thiouridine synthesizing protein C